MLNDFAVNCCVHQDHEVYEVHRLRELQLRFGNNLRVVHNVRQTAGEGSTVKIPITIEIRMKGRGA
jgi:hypothetical protein